MKEFSKNLIPVFEIQRVGEQIKKSRGVLSAFACE